MVPRRAKKRRRGADVESDTPCLALPLLIASDELEQLRRQNQGSHEQVAEISIDSRCTVSSHRTLLLNVVADWRHLEHAVFDVQTALAPYRCPHDVLHVLVAVPIDRAHGDEGEAVISPPDRRRKR